jgi:predicted metal-dependent hydrolase
VTFKSKRLDLDWSQDLPKYWLDNDPVKTHFFNSLSIAFTGRGEIAFIDAIRGSLDKINDPVLHSQCLEFIKQESQHNRVHKQYNEWLDTQGLPATLLEKKAFDHYQLNKHKMSFKTLLVITACQEHNTSIIAGHILGNEELSNQMHPHFRKIWQWHSVEELEHRSVAFDTMLHLKMSAPVKIITVVLSILLMCKLLKTTILLLHADKKLFKFDTIRGFCNLFFSTKTGLIKSIVPWLKILKSDFHPKNQYVKLLEEKQNLKNAN